MLELFNLILDVAKSLLKVVNQLRGAEYERRASMAILFEEISICLASLSSEIRLGNIPYKTCLDLCSYVQQLPDKIRQEVGPAQAQKLGATLSSVCAVENLAYNIGQVADPEPYLKQIEEASGKFQSLANIMRSP